MSTPGSGFSANRLLSVLRQQPAARGLLVGFSGGADSTALLHALFRIRDRLAAPLRAVHFHHGLHPDADSWSDHCRQFCFERSIPLTSHPLEIGTRTTSNFEAVARNARYKVVAELLGPEEFYLTAHHADDQAETVFLNLMRGSGAEGLSGIPELRKLGMGWVSRPLLNWARQDLVDYLERHDVAWMNDPSNQDDTFDRNFLRNRLFPLVEERWPGLSKRLNRSARISRVTSEALAHFINLTSGDLLSNPNRMSLETLLQLEPAMQALVIRQWLRSQEIPPPPEARLLEFMDQLAAGSRNSRAEVCWGNWRIKRYRNHAWLQDLTAELLCRETEWSKNCELELGPGLGRMMIQPVTQKVPQGWQIGRRRKGERLRLHQGTGRCSLKECFRQSGIPPWLRDSIPVLYWNGEAVAVGDWLLAEKLSKWLSTNQARYVWHPSDPVLRDIRDHLHH